MTSDAKHERLFATEQGGKFIVKLLNDEKPLSQTDLSKYKKSVLWDSMEVKTALRRSALRTRRFSKFFLCAMISVARRWTTSPKSQKIKTPKASAQPSGSDLSGREDLNLRPLAPHASALAGLRHAPIGKARL